MTLTVPDLQQVAAMLDAEVSPEDAALYRPRWNAAPTDLHWMVTANRSLVPARWGFAGGNGSLLINARSETADRLPAFREAFARRRVVVPADGFYEWTGPRSDRRPIWFHPSAGGLLYLAGLSATGPDGKSCFVVLTTRAEGVVSSVHDRMPALLERERVGDWLERPDGGLLVPLPALLSATEVSQRANAVENDDASLLEPSKKPPPPKQLGLF